jgi:hypothetical protein
MGNRFIKLIISTLLICSSFYTKGNAQKISEKDSQSTEEIEIILGNYYTTMSARDWPAYKDFFSNDATLTTIWQQETDTIPKIFTNSINDFIAQTKNGPDSQPIFEEKMLSADITVKNNLAQAWVRYEAKFGSSDNLVEWKGLDLFSLIRYNDEWKIVSIVFESE